MKENKMYVVAKKDTKELLIVTSYNENECEPLYQFEFPVNLKYFLQAFSDMREE